MGDTDPQKIKSKRSKVRLCSYTVHRPLEGFAPRDFAPSLKPGLMR